MAGIRRVSAILEDLDCATRHFSVPFTVADVLARAHYTHSPKEVASLLRVKAIQGRLRRVASRVGSRGLARFERIPGIALTKHLPKGLIAAAVWEALSDDRERRWTYPELVWWVAEYAGRPEHKVRQAVSRILRVWAANGHVQRIGKPGTGRSKYRLRYRLADNVQERPVVTVA